MKYINMNIFAGNFEQLFRCLDVRIYDQHRMRKCGCLPKSPMCTAVIMLSLSPVA